MQTLGTIQHNMKTDTLTLSEILSRLMFQRRIRTTELARQVNIPQPTLSRIVSGVTTNPHQAALEVLANFFSLTVDQLKGQQPIPWLNQQNVETSGWIQIPLLTWKEATRWTKNKNEMKDNEHILTDAKVGINAYALTMKDASMEPQFTKNTILIIDPDKIPRDRSFVIAIIKDYPEVIFRQLLIDGPYQYLKPISPDFDRFKMSLLDKRDKISGVLVQARRNYEE